jgi:hypothetical protein
MLQLFTVDLNEILVLAWEEQIPESSVAALSMQLLPVIYHRIFEVYFPCIYRSAQWIIEVNEICFSLCVSMCLFKFSWCKYSLPYIFTGMIFMGRMNEQVFLEIPSKCEIPAALVTWVWLFSTLYYSMFLQVSLLAQCFATDVTGVRL